MLTLLAVFSLLGWLYLLLLRGRFWLADQILPAVPPLGGGALPSVVALVPARNEETVIRRSLSGLMAQDYPGPFRILVVDDGSEDDTAAAIEATLAETRSAVPVTLVAAPPRPAGWTGKLAALKAGMEAATQNGQTPIYWWFTDADIAHGPSVLSRLVTAAVGSKREMVSQLAKLDSSGPWARLLIPAFVFFFQKLYPFRWVNDNAARTAAAAGGSLLVQNYALQAGGGLAAIRHKMIDDCAMARLVKNGRLRGHLWLGLADDSVSLRPNRDLQGLWEMVARTASEQLRHNPLWLAATLAMLALLYLVPALAVLSLPLHGHTLTALNGLLALACMLVAYAPTLRRYGQPPWNGITLPFVALLYGAMTVDSMLRHWRGRGGQWKGRAAPPSPRRAQRLTGGDRAT